jgi:hypothetical protein
MPDALSLPGAAKADFDLANERYWAGIKAGYTPEQADELYLQPMKLKWAALQAASPRTTQSISGSFEPADKADAQEMDLALERFYKGTKAGYDPKDATAMYIMPSVNKVRAAGWARQEQDRANTSDALMQEHNAKLEAAKRSDMGASMAADVLRETGSPSLAIDIPTGLGLYLTPELKMALTKEVNKQREGAMTLDPNKVLNKAGSIAMQGKRLSESPLFSEVTPSGTNVMTQGAQDLIQAAMGSIRRPGGVSPAGDLRGLLSTNQGWNKLNSGAGYRRLSP